MTTSKTIVFFGSGPVAAECLEKLVKHTAIEYVITKPAPERLHRKFRPPVELICEKLNIPVGFVANKASLTEFIATSDFTSSVGVVIDFGIIIEKTVIDYFKHGILNSHFSLLPQWRGADPISFSILSGQKKTGVSIMSIDKGLDTGPLLAQAELVIDDAWDSARLTSALIGLSDKLLQCYLLLWMDEKIEAYKQDKNPILGNVQPTYTRKLTKKDGQLRLDIPASVLTRQVRAFSEWPKSKLIVSGTGVTVIRAHSTPNSESMIHSESVYYHTEKQALCFQTPSGIFEVTELQPDGKKPMSATAFMNGYGLSIPRF